MAFTNAQKRKLEELFTRELVRRQRNGDPTPLTDYVLLPRPVQRAFLTALVDADKAGIDAAITTHTTDEAVRLAGLQTESAALAALDIEISSL